MSAESEYTAAPIDKKNEEHRVIPALEALKMLKEGNQRFAAGLRDRSLPCDKSQRDELIIRQSPFAIILGCSDSRVPAELVFDQGLGDLFVIRVAGNIVAPSQVGSVEFAAERFGTRLVVVLGHSKCGAVTATLEQLRQPKESRSPNLSSIVNRIRPSVETLLETGLDDETVLRHAVRANIRTSTTHLRSGSTLLEELIQKDELLVVGAEYSLESGVVDFFDGVPKVSAA